MKAGKGFGWLANARAALEGREGFAPLSGAALKQRMGGVMLYRGKAYTFQPPEVLAGGLLSGGQVTLSRRSAQGGELVEHHGSGGGKAQQAEAELEARIAAEAEARAAYLDSLETPRPSKIPRSLRPHLEDERRAQQAHVDSLENTQTLEDPAVIARASPTRPGRRSRRRRPSSTSSGPCTRRPSTPAARPTPAPATTGHGVDNEQNDRKIAKMEATRDAAVASATMSWPPSPPCPPARATATTSRSQVEA